MGLLEHLDRPHSRQTDPVIFFYHSETPNIRLLEEKESSVFTCHKNNLCSVVDTHSYHILILDKATLVPVRLLEKKLFWHRTQ